MIFRQCEVCSQLPPLGKDNDVDPRAEQTPCSPGHQDPETSPVSLHRPRSLRSHGPLRRHQRTSEVTLVAPHQARRMSIQDVPGGTQTLHAPVDNPGAFRWYDTLSFQHLPPAHGNFGQRRVLRGFEARSAVPGINLSKDAQRRVPPSLRLPCR